MQSNFITTLLDLKGITVTKFRTLNLKVNSTERLSRI